MDLRTASGVVRRHYKIVTLGLLLTVVAAILFGKNIKPNYEAKATWIFLSSAVTQTPDGETQSVNPFNTLGSAEAAVSTAVYTVTQSDGWALRMRDAGATGEYEFKPLSEVINQLTVTDGSAQGAMTTLDTGLQLVKEELERRQQAAGAPEGSLIGMDILSKSATPDELTGSSKRAMGAVAAIGIVLTLALAFLLDADPVTRALRRFRIRAALVSFRAVLPFALRAHRLRRTPKRDHDSSPPDEVAWPPADPPDFPVPAEARVPTPELAMTATRNGKGKSPERERSGADADGRP
jgi:hypothetical protein